MFKRFMVTLLFMLATSLLVIPARAADSTWMAWLYENDIGRMTQVDSSGTMLKQFQLPTDTGSAYSRNAAISADGLLIAYATANSSANTVKIYDVTTNAVIYTFDAPPNANTSLDFDIGSLNFSENHATFAFGYAGVGIPWKIIVIDIAALSVSSLKQEDPISASLNDNNAYLMPVVTYNRNNEIKFLMIPLGTDGAPSYKAYTWNITANTITTNDAYITPDTATLAGTNEVLSTLPDDNFPDSRLPFTGFPSNNTLQVFNPAANQRFIVTALPRIYDPQFIQGGERIAVTRYDDQQDGSQTQTLQILERSGAVSGTVNAAPTTNINGVLGTEDGFIFAHNKVEADPKSNITNLYAVETRQSSAGYNALLVWSSAPGTNGRLIWVSNAEAPNTAPFTEWGRVNPPAVPPTPIPSGNGTYAIGMQAMVQTTNNDVLNLRSAPGLNFSRLGTVPNGTMVTLIEGPQNADGLIWWRIRLPTGVEGWVVIEVDGVKTLVTR